MLRSSAASRARRVAAGTGRLALAGADSARVSRRSRLVRIAVTANDRDADGDPLRVLVSRRPKRGTVSVSGRRIVYRPKKRWPGRDSFAYRLIDPSGATATATVRVTGPRRR